MTEEELKEMHERLVSKSYYQVEVVAIRFYHLKVYNEALNENCSSCVRESYDKLKKWYHGQIESEQQRKDRQYNKYDGTCKIEKE